MREKGDGTGLQQSPAGSGGLPAPISTFVGRGKQTGRAVRLLAEHKALTVTGLPGVGKSRLALRAAAVAAPAYPDGVRYTDLRSSRGDDVLPQIAARLGVPKALPRRDPATMLARLVGEKRMLLVLDNCDSVSEAAGHAIDSLLELCPRISVLAAGVQRLGAKSHGFRLLPMAVPRPGRMSEQALLACESVQLFCDRAGAVQPGFSMTPRIASEVAEICRITEGIPLAIELAASRMAALSPGEILEGLSDRFGFLAARRGRGGASHPGLLQAFDSRFILLSPLEQDLLARLSVFASGFRDESVIEICTGRRFGPGDIVELLWALQEKSWLEAGRRSSEAGHRMLSTVKDYVGRKLPPARATALRRKHQAWYAQVAEEGKKALDGRRQQFWLGRLDAERDNLVMALHGSISAGRTEPALVIAAGLGTYGKLRGFLKQSREWLTIALEASDNSGSLAEADTRLAFATIAALQGDHKAARIVIEPAVVVYRQTHHARGMARAFSILGLSSLYRHPDQAVWWLQQSAATAEKAGDKPCFLEALTLTGEAARLMQRFRQAERCFAQAVELARRTGNKAGLARALGGLASVGAQPEADVSSDRAIQALKTSRRLGDPAAELHALLVMGNFARRSGDPQRARELTQQSLLISNGMGLAAQTVVCLLALGELSVADGDPGRARSLFRDSVDRSVRHEFLFLEVRGLIGLGKAEALAGNRQAAGHLWRQVGEAAAVRGDTAAVVEALLLLGDSLRQEGDDEQAWSMYANALYASRDLESQEQTEAALRAMGELALPQGRLSTAGSLLASAHFLRRRVGGPKVTPRAAYLRRIAKTGNTGAEDFKSGWRQGAAMNLDELIASVAGDASAERAKTGWASLTPSEREIASLAAEGLSNREIGQRLVISPRTAGNHLFRVFAKLGISSRKQLRSMTLQRRRDNT